MVTLETPDRRSAATRGRRRGRPLVLAVVAVLLLAAAGAWLNSRAFGQLLTAVEVSEAVLEGYNADVAAVIRTFPTVYATDADRESARASLKSAADDALGAVLVDRQEVRDVRLWPWDRDAIKARDRYLEHLAAWETRLREVGSGTFDGSGAEITATFTLVNDALSEAVPLISSDYEARVVEIGRE